MDISKRNAAKKAITFVKDGMFLGLGTGSTVNFFLEELGKKVNEGLDVTCVSSSERTSNIAKELGIKVLSMNEVEVLDLSIDGTDEFDDDFDGIKGGGGALLFEKIVATNSKKNIWIADESKHVKKLGEFALPVEVIPMNRTHLLSIFEKKNLSPKLRKKEGKVYTTDSKNNIIDLDLKCIENKKEMANFLKSLVGVVEHGLFLEMTDIVIVGKKDGADVLVKE